MTEQQLQNAIIDYLNYRGHHVWRVNSGMIPQTYKGKKRLIRMAPAGTSDIIGVHKGTGRMLAIEVKLDYNKPTAKQQAFIDKINSKGGIAFAAYSVEDVREQLEKYA